MDKLQFKDYMNVAKEIADRTGNLFLAEAVLRMYLNIAQTYTMYPIEVDEYRKVSEGCKELRQLVLQYSKGMEDSDRRLNTFLTLLESSRR